MKYYAVYLRKNDQLLASLNSFHSLVSNVKSGRNKKYEVLVEDQEEE